MTLHHAFTVVHGSTTLVGLENLDVQTNPEVQNDTGIGSQFPQFVAITAQKPRILFAARQVALALGVTGATGAAIDASDTLVSYFASVGTTGLPAAGSVHRSYTANRGLLLPRRLTAAHRQPARLDMEALLYSADGAAHPLVIADNVALPTLTPANVEHTIGPMTLGVSGSTFEFGCATNVVVDFGNNAQTRGCNSDLFDTHVEQPGIQPMITLTGLNATAFGASGVPPVGKKLEHASSTLYLRKRDQGIGFVADLTAEHIALTINGVAVVTSHTGQGTAGAEVSMQLYGSWDGTNAPITIDTASAIS